MNIDTVNSAALDIGARIFITKNNIPFVYEAGPPSSICKADDLSKDWTKIHRRRKEFHPVCFYDCHPQISCAYLFGPVNKKPAILARTLIFTADNGTANFGPIYAKTLNTRCVLGHALIAMGYKCIDTVPWTTTQKFVVQGVKIRTLAFMPLPYFDTLEPVFIHWMKPADKFLVSNILQPKLPHISYDGKSHRGFITDQEIVHNVA